VLLLLPSTFSVEARTPEETTEKKAKEEKSYAGLSRRASPIGRG
jgi:hypothetical protein